MSTITAGVERYQPTLTPTEAVGAGGHNHDRASRPQVQVIPREDGGMSGARRVGRYPDEVRERAVRMVFDH